MKGGKNNNHVHDRADDAEHVVGRLVLGDGSRDGLRCTKGTSISGRERRGP